ncbi:MAG: hypothetical protein HZB38_01145, partial [Planctomycetes bacterium]|nr:hypothetical protein [Planctomycetota bacterium]
MNHRIGFFIGRVERRECATIFLSAWLCCAATAQQRLSETVHNLAVSGPGRVHAQSEQQICLFCHAPHNTAGVRPLWNRTASTASYLIYQSSTLNALPGQPNGSSKLCLSCHDGTIALGSVLNRPDQIRMSGGDFMPAGLTNLGTDLSDDHPISFQYTQGLATQDGQLVNPGLLPPPIRLDSSSQVQCTSCHDAHNNSHGSFLVMDNAYSGLCVACHSMNGWTGGAHRTSAASTAGATGVSFPFATVGENACRSCHRPHTAGGHARLNIFDVDEDNCLDCHNGSVARTNIRAQLDKFSAHDPRRYAQLHDPTEAANVPPAHVECADCHNPHAVFNEPAAPGYTQIGNTLRRSRGVTASGSAIQEAQYEYEVCLRCHGDTVVSVSGRIGRHSDVPNLRMRFANTNASFHPVFASVVGNETISLIPGMPHGSMIRCTDCHNNDQGRR